MLKVVMNGAIDSLSTVSDLDEAMTILFPALNNPNVSGNIVNAETGEALIIVENGNAVYISPEIMTDMLDAIFEADPMLGLGLVVELMDTLMGD